LKSLHEVPAPTLTALLKSPIHLPAGENAGDGGSLNSNVLVSLRGFLGHFFGDVDGRHLFRRRSDFLGFDGALMNGRDDHGGHRGGGAGPFLRRLDLYRFRLWWRWWLQPLRLLKDELNGGRCRTDLRADYGFAESSKGLDGGHPCGQTAVESQRATHSSYPDAIEMPPK